MPILLLPDKNPNKDVHIPPSYPLPNDYPRSMPPDGCPPHFASQKYDNPLISIPLLPAKPLHGNVSSLSAPDLSKQLQPKPANEDKSYIQHARVSVYIPSTHFPVRPTRNPVYQQEKLSSPVRMNKPFPAGGILRWLPVAYAVHPDSCQNSNMLPVTRWYAILFLQILHLYLLHATPLQQKFRPARLSESHPSQSSCGRSLSKTSQFWIQDIPAIHLPPSFPLLS